MQFIGSLLKNPSSPIVPVLPPARSSSPINTTAGGTPQATLPASSLSYDDLLLLTSKLGKKVNSLQKRYANAVENFERTQNQLLALRQAIEVSTGQPLERFQVRSDAPGGASTGELEFTLDVDAIVAWLTQKYTKVVEPAASATITSPTSAQSDMQSMSRSLEIQIHRLTQELSSQEQSARAREQMLKERLEVQDRELGDSRREILLLSETLREMRVSRAHNEMTERTMANVQVQLHQLKSKVAGLRSECGVIAGSAHRDLSFLQQYACTQVSQVLSFLKDVDIKSSLNAEQSEELTRLRKEVAIRSARSQSALAEKERTISALQEQVQSLRSSANATPVSGAPESLLLMEIADAHSHMRLNRAQESVLKDTIRDLQRQVDTLSAVSPGVNATYLRNVLLQFIGLLNAVPLTMPHKVQKDALARVIAALFRFDGEECKKCGIPGPVPPSPVPTVVPQPSRASIAATTLSPSPPQAMPAAASASSSSSVSSGVMRDVMLSPDGGKQQAQRTPPLMKPRRLVGVETLENEDYSGSNGYI